MIANAAKIQNDLMQLSDAQLQTATKSAQGGGDPGYAILVLGEAARRKKMQAQAGQAPQRTVAQDLMGPSEMGIGALPQGDMYDAPQDMPAYASGGIVSFGGGGSVDRRSKELLDAYNAGMNADALRAAEDEGLDPTRLQAQYLSGDFGGAYAGKPKAERSVHKGINLNNPAEVRDSMYRAGAMQKLNEQLIARDGAGQAAQTPADGRAAADAALTAELNRQVADAGVPRMPQVEAASFSTGTYKEPPSVLAGAIPVSYKIPQTQSAAERQPSGLSTAPSRINSLGGVSSELSPGRAVDYATKSGLMTLAEPESALAQLRAAAGDSPSAALSPTSYKIPQTQSAAAQQPSGLSTAPASAPAYVVKKGDTAWAIAKTLGTTVSELAKANPTISDMSKLAVGDKLAAPAGGMAAAPAQAPRTVSAASDGVSALLSPAQSRINSLGGVSSELAPGRAVDYATKSGLMTRAEPESAPAQSRAAAGAPPSAALAQALPQSSDTVAAPVGPAVPTTAAEGPIDMPLAASAATSPAAHQQGLAALKAGDDAFDAAVAASETGVKDEAAAQARAAWDAQQAKSAAATEADFNGIASLSPNVGVTYDVVKGDTLTKIAKQFRTTPDAIAAASGLKDKNKIEVGERLQIPAAGGIVPPAPKAKRKQVAASDADRIVLGTPVMTPMEKLSDALTRGLGIGDAQAAEFARLPLDATLVRRQNTFAGVNVGDLEFVVGAGGRSKLSAQGTPNDYSPHAFKDGKFVPAKEGAHTWRNTLADLGVTPKEMPGVAMATPAQVSAEAAGKKAAAEQAAKTAADRQALIDKIPGLGVPAPAAAAPAPAPAAAAKPAAAATPIVNPAAEDPTIQWPDYMAKQMAAYDAANPRQEVKYTDAKKLAALQALKDREKGSGERNINLAMIQAGLAMMGGKSANALQNVAEGGLAGLQAYMQGGKENREAEMKILELDVAIEEAQRAGDKEAAAEARAERKEYMATLTDAEKMRIERLKVDAINAKGAGDAAAAKANLVVSLAQAELKEFNGNDINTTILSGTRPTDPNSQPRYDALVAERGRLNRNLSDANAKLYAIHGIPYQPVGVAAGAPAGTILGSRPATPAAPK